MADPFHQTSVPDEDVREVIENLLAVARPQILLGDRESHRVAETLTQGAGCGLYTLGIMDLWMPRRSGAKLPEIPQLLQRHVLVAGQVQQRIKEHRAVAVRQDEAIAIGPAWRRGIEFEMAREKNGRDVRHAHRHPGVPGICRLNRIHGQNAEGGSHLRVFRMFFIQLREVHGTHPSAGGWLAC